MMQHVIQSLQNGAEEGIRVINDTIDDAIYISPEEQADAMAAYDAKKEMDSENSRIDRINEKIDGCVENTKQKVNRINQSFDRGIEKVKEVNRSDFMKVYRTARMIHWAKLAKDYVSNNPDIAKSISQFGDSMATRLRRMGISDIMEDEQPMTETEQICARRDAMFGSPDAGVQPDAMPTTEAILSGAEVPMDFMESIAFEAAM